MAFSEQLESYSHLFKMYKVESNPPGALTKTPLANPAFTVIWSTACRIFSAGFWYQVTFFVRSWFFMVRLQNGAPQSHTNYIHLCLPMVFLGSTRAFTALNFGNTTPEFGVNPSYPTSQMDVSPCPVSWRQISAQATCKKQTSEPRKNTGLPYFPWNPGWLTRILILVYYNPHITG